MLSIIVTSRDFAPFSKTENATDDKENIPLIHFGISHGSLWR